MPLRRVLSGLVVLVVAAGASICLHAQQPSGEPNSSQTIESGNDESTIRRLGQSWNDAYRTHDVAWLEHNLADDIVIILANGTKRSKSESIAAMLKSKLLIDVLESSEADSRVNVAGDIAVETGIVHLRGRDTQGETVDQRYRYTAMYVRRAGRWLALLDHLTEIR
jgi:ketosteroid isomerase-like protein